MVKVSTPFGFWFYIVMLAILFAISYPMARFPFRDNPDPVVVIDHMEAFQLFACFMIGYLACAVFFVRWIEERGERKSKEKGVIGTTTDE